MKHLELFNNGFDSTITEKVKAANYPYVGYDAVSGEVAFTEPAPEYEYVDLGLSVKWATCNVGATKPEDLGDYFAWGETEPKEVYDWSTYKWCNGSETTLTKYCTDGSYGTVDNKTQLELSDDAAHVNWGGDWRVPTEAEQAELDNNCTWTVTTQNGVTGHKATSKSNGNSIFLPTAGYDITLGFAGKIWSSSIDMNNPNNAGYMYFNSRGVNTSKSSRYQGLHVRPVHP